jgi:hypothetical protein
MNPYAPPETLETEATPSVYWRCFGERVMARDGAVLPKVDLETGVSEGEMLAVPRSYQATSLTARNLLFTGGPETAVGLDRRAGKRGLIHLHWGKSYYHTKIYHGFRQWCAPLVPGMRVVDSKVSGPYASGIAKPGVKASSFLSADSSKLIVHVAAVQDQDADLEIRVAAPFADAPFRMWRTGREEDFVELPSGRAANGRITTRLPGRGLLTISLERTQAK